MDALQRKPETRWFRTISGMFNVEISFLSFFPSVFEGSGGLGNLKTNNPAQQKPHKNS